jgi:hypothetical protein
MNQRFRGAGPLTRARPPGRATDRAGGRVADEGAHLAQLRIEVRGLLLRRLCQLADARAGNG